MSVLETRVKAVNRANAYVNEIAPQLLAVFAKFVGQKIIKSDGHLTGKVQKCVDGLNLTNTNKLAVYFEKTRPFVRFTVKTCENYPDGRGGIAYYHQTGINIGWYSDADPSVLTGLYEFESRKTDYDAKEIEALRTAYKNALKAVNEAENALSPFGVCDR